MCVPVYSGAATWPLWRGDGALWLAYFFGGLPPISPGWCNEGAGVHAWKHGCANTVAEADLPYAHGLANHDKRLPWLRCNAKKLFEDQARARRAVVRAVGRDGLTGS